MAEDQLHRLIHSMSAAERGYFKKFASFTGKRNANKYLQLYEAMEKLHIYKTSDLLKLLKHKSDWKHLPVLKSICMILYLEA